MSEENLLPAGERRTLTDDDRKIVNIDRERERLRTGKHGWSSIVREIEQDKKFWRLMQHPGRAGALRTDEIIQQLEQERGR